MPEDTVNISSYIINGFDLVRPEPDTDVAPSIVNIHLVSNGKIVGYAPLMTYDIIAVQRGFSEERVDIEFSNVIQRSKKSLLSSILSKSEVPLGREFTMNADSVVINKAADQMIRSGELTLYVLATFIWSDSTLSNNWYWQREFCAWQKKDLTVPAYHRASASLRRR
jgi:hypothetical protein